MKTIYLECAMGAAGDMLTAALLELVPDQEKALQEIRGLNIPDVTISAEKMEKCGILGTHMRVLVGGEEEADPDGHYHQHHHTSLSDVEHFIDQMNIAEEVKVDIRNVYHLIAEAEGHAHGRAVDQIHFHEVGTMDALMDVSAVCMLIHMLQPGRIVASPVCTGYGEVRCAHGILPVPAPATAYLLRGIPSYSGGVEREMCTPTGAALLKYFAGDFGRQPLMRVEKVGYGMGTRDFPRANCIRAFLGESEDFSGFGISEGENTDTHTGSGEPEGEKTGDEGQEDRILELRANIDDMTGEEIGFAVEKILAKGARDVFTTAIGMKKNRPAVLLTVLCVPADREKMTAAIFHYTTTIGIRETVCRRSILRRREEVRHTAFGDVRVKISSGYGAEREKIEYEDLRALAEKNGRTFEEIRRAAYTAENQTSS